MKRLRRLAAAGILAGLLPGLPAGHPTGPAPGPLAGPLPAAAAGVQEAREQVVVLDVPYLPQAPALCGGAAAAMVIRYWLGDGPEPEAFSPLVEETAGGIRTTRLVDDLRRRGYRVRPLPGGLADLRTHVDSGRPVVALLEVAPDRFHYVVVVSVVPEGILLHDPARAPYRFLPAEEFVRRWSAADSWAMLLLPEGDEGDATPGAAPDTVAEARRDTAPRRRGEEAPGRRPRSGGPDRGVCSGMVDRGVDWAGEGRLREAEGVLEAAAARCPREPAPWRELAGVRFRLERWEEAGEAARRALALAPEDAHALRILAGSRYLLDDLDGALRAWNRLGEPAVGSPRVFGLQRIGYRSLMGHLGLPARGLLTPELLRRSRRRAESMPGLSASRLWYRPPPGDPRAGLRVAVVERPRFPPSAAGILGWGLRSLGARRIELDAAGPAELAWSAAARPWGPRPEAALEVSVPGLFGVPGAWSVGGSWERERYAAGPTDAAAAIHEERFAARLGWSRWAGADVRVGLGAGLYRWPGRGRSGALDGSLEWRAPTDRVSVSARTTGWTGPGEGPSFARWGAALAARSSAGRQGLVARGRLTYEATMPEAPPSEWPGAGAGVARPTLLRAHPLLTDGTVRGEAFGRRLASAGVGVDLWRTGPGPLRVGLGGFADVAKAWSRPGGAGPSALHVDVGLGLRASVGEGGGTVRLNLARGLRDGETAVTVGWSRPWPATGACCGFP